MALNIFKKLFGSRNERLLKQYRKKVQQINALEESLSQLSDDELRAKTDYFKSQISEGISLDQILPEAFAVVREAGKRVMGMRHYDTQLIGGMVLHEGKISEMRTGEGKTLVATLPAYLNALSGKGVHVITVNDYLASRDAEWMGQLYGFLGLTTGVVLSGQTSNEKQTAYNADITYGTNNEFGFDYLRDNMAIFAEERVMRGQNFAIVDEVDSILIDEARTPLIISGPAEDKSDLYQKMNPLVKGLERGEEDLETKTSSGDYTIDEKSKQIHLTDEGHSKVEAMLVEVGLLEEGDSLYDAEHISLMKYVNASLRAHLLFEKNTDYIVQDNEVVIIDEFTGRKMSGRRWGDGLHQAVEAKEGVPIQAESQTYASITFQNYFRQYTKLSGMTGTADTEAGEFLSTYSLEVVVVPTNKVPKRQDLPDLVFLDIEGKLAAIVREVKEVVKTRQPILVGTASIELSEVLSSLFEKEGIPHNVLNAKQHEKEATIIAQAGRPGAVTIATNMAGRGTDIVLGGNLDMEIESLDNPTEAQIAEIKADWEVRHDEVVEKGGLMVIGSERHESRRIDNQLRGRSGRQGDPGVTRFYLSLDDDLMRRFASEKVKNMMRRLGMKSDEAIEHNMVTKSIERAQKQVERMHQDERANLLKFDNISNEQRKVVYAQRNELMEEEDVSEIIDALRENVIETMMAGFIPPGSIEEQWNVSGLEKQLQDDLGLTFPISDWLQEDKGLFEEKLREKIIAEAKVLYQNKMAVIDEKTRHHFEKEVLLRTIDKQWREHLNEMDYLRRWIHLKGFAQKDPFQEYRATAAEMFEAFLDEVMFETVQTLSMVQIQGADDVDAYEKQQIEERPQELEANHPAAKGISDAVNGSSDSEQDSADATYRRETPKVGRNDPCPCGSGKKYKQCCGKLN
ncbi:Protein translocase subunit SecA [Hydrogenovibrio crunogenus]|uniref:Protein translocase subunit SecA n=1 Tax=Hydrogenovibrio crunogenus TaxID=39765 RepID=A0A4V1C8P2_9GAMM|nr:preprotein translocase subunit SecA [Hydrogenovibrio crunogenus]QBZ82594.1 Protein translocase subunit SecA [Hydrogenovibrio crunogenus]